MADVENGATPEHHEPAGPSTAERDGDSRAEGSAFRAVYDQVVQVVKKRFERKLGTDLAEEIAAKVGMRAWKKWQKDPRSLADPAKVPRYANKAATNLQKNALRDGHRVNDKHERFGRARGVVRGDMWSNAEMDLEIHELQTCVTAVLNGLTRRAREVGKLVARGYKANEIAKILKITPESARAHERRFQQAVLAHYLEGTTPRSQSKRPRMAQ